MPGNPLKEFFQRRKAEVKFARAGPGKTLSSASDNPSSSDQSSARQAAAEAAMKRFSKDNSKPAQRPRITPEVRTSSGAGASGSKDLDKITTSGNTEKITAIPKELPVIDGVPQRNIQLLSTEELAQRIKHPDIDDDFFRLTVDDAKLFKQRYEEERARNEILRTSEMRRREAEAKTPTTNISRLRFKLPNNMVLEASFSANETLSFIRDWLVATCLEKLGMELKNFDLLFGFKPIRQADFNKNVKELGLIPATTLTVMTKNN